MSKLCEGRVAIVTGGARGIGREYCLMLAENGAKVIVNDLGGDRAGSDGSIGPAEAVVEEIKAMGGEAVANGDNVADFKGAKNMIDQAIDTFGTLDAVVNNAGILRDRMMVNMTEEEWDAVINVHLKGTFAPAHHAAVYWRNKAKESGEPVNARIINTSSVSGIYGNVGQCNYGAAKAGIASFTVITAMELARYGVTCNAIAPVAHTRMTEDLRDFTEEQIARRDPKYVAPIATWLVSEDSKDITGRVFESCGYFFAVAEGWHRGPMTENPSLDPREIGALARQFVAEARPNAGMDGKDRA
ncbi:MAG: SDR family NAD(P)-dependent oxidoreductase [Alphaproteobacteria bacterium]|nr:MAG: SDR family NAD(P)-dependent oxidoreductase [Alphaproteobacteria bacterium]